MKGSSHIVTNTCSLLVLSTDLYLLQQYLPTNAINDNIAIVSSQVSSYMSYNILGSVILSYGICLFLFYIGTILPDCDSRKSIIGKYFYLSIPHRTWTHTIWVPLLFFLIGIWLRSVTWLSLGYFLHLFWDSLSVGGICWFYPFEQYITYPSGAQVKKRHWLKLYRVGGTSEKVVVFVVFLLTVLTLGIAYHVIYDSVDGLYALFR